MKTVQMTMEEELVDSVDKIAKILNTSRSAFTRRALRDAIKRYQIECLEEKHRKGYEQNPVHDGEFDLSEEDQVWGD